MSATGNSKDPKGFSSNFLASLATLLKEEGLQEIEYQQGDSRVRIVKESPQAVAPAVPTLASVDPRPLQAVSAPSAPSQVDEKPSNLLSITSPMVGTAYLSPAPETPPFVSVGQAVKEGDTLMIVEAMKVMNPIKATRNGTVASIKVTNGQAVEYGEALVTLDPMESAHAS